MDRVPCLRVAPPKTLVSLKVTYVPARISFHAPSSPKDKGFSHILCWSRMDGATEGRGATVWGFQLRMFWLGKKAFISRVEYRLRTCYATL